MQLSVAVAFEPRDLWLGVFWNRRRATGTKAGGGYSVTPILELYVCVVPCLPVRVTVAGRTTTQNRAGDWKALRAILN